MKKKEETNDIIQYLLPLLKSEEIDKDNCKIDVTTERSGRKRGDIWISSISHKSRQFEGNIIALIEAKHRNSIVGDIDWRDAMSQGKEKALSQGLSYYIVTNCRSDVRYYNAFTDDELTLDGNILTKFVPLDVLKKIKSQVTEYNSLIIHKTGGISRPLSESRFRDKLRRLAEIYRSAGLKKGDERIDPTISFVVLKYISESEREERTLNEAIELWDDFKEIRRGNLRAKFETTTDLIWGKNSEYKNNIYKDFKDLISFPNKLKNEHFKNIYAELDSEHLHGAKFDLFGTIYEEFASQTKKKEFGEFYTRRHITNIVAKILLRDEKSPREFKICDPACGTGGFLTEAFKILESTYSENEKLDEIAKGRLKEETFWGFDSESKSIARTKLNMFLVGDGHVHINDNDSLTSWNGDLGWNENSFEYIMTNPPMGKYTGDANISEFSFTNEKRYELLFTEKVINATTNGGNIAIVLNDGALEAPSRNNFRKKILDFCNIQGIISLTKFAFAPYTKEKTYVLFMQKKKLADIGNKQKFPIWTYIVDYDGYANSDKRFKTKYHDDLVELEQLFSNAVDNAKLFTTNKQKYHKEKEKYERDCNIREQSEGLYGKKCGYIEISDINSSNFHNLLSEFYLRPIQFDITTVDELLTNLDEIYEKIRDLKNNSEYLPNLLNQLKYLIYETQLTSLSGKNKKLSEIVDITGGNSGLIEEFIYHNQPTSIEDKIPIFSGATITANFMGYITPKSRPNNNDLKIFEGECILVARKGNAGKMTYIKEGKFATNDDAYVLTIKKEWKSKLNLRWFVYQYQDMFYNLVTSKSDNATFNKEYAENQEILLPDKEKIQDIIADRLLNADKLIGNTIF